MIAVADCRAKSDNAARLNLAHAPKDCIIGETISRSIISEMQNLELYIIGELPNPNENVTADDLERRKLALEISDLEYQHSRIGRFVKLVPVLTTLVAVGGLVFSFYSVQRAQKAESEKRYAELNDRLRNDALDRVNRIQAQIRSDKEQILEFGINDRISSIRAGFLMEDLQSLIEQLPKPGSETATAQLRDTQKKAEETSAELLRRIAWDLSFSEKRHFDFDVQALRRLNSYKQSWIDNPDAHHLFLVNKYFHRIQKLREENAACVEKLDYEGNTTILTYKDAATTCNEDLINAWIYGFGEHLRAMKAADQALLLYREVLELSKFTNSRFAEKFSAKL